MRDRVKLAIIGSGVTGLSVAYALANKGFADIAILEKGFLSSGASSRNGGGVRAQFTTQENIVLAKWSIQRFRMLGAELNSNFWFRQGGYLFVAESEQELSSLENAVQLQRANGLGTNMLDCGAIQEMVPEMVCATVIGGSYRKGDGVLFPFPLLYGYAENLRSRGVAIETQCEVRSISAKKEGFDLDTAKGVLHADMILNAAGGWSSQIGGMLGVTIPTHPVRHQIMVSEPLAPFLKPMIVTLKDGFYMSQGPRGELVGGVTEPEPHGDDIKKSSSQFCRQISSRIISLFPRLSSTRMMRQWGGFYDMSPDANPILDRVPGLDGAFVACGYSGHGFMISPAVGEFMSCMIMGKKPPFPTEPYGLKRFASGEIRREKLVIG